MAPLMHKLALLSSLATISLVQAHGFRSSNAGRGDNELGLGWISAEMSGSLAGQDLRVRADAKLCGSVNGEDQKCPQGQVCSVDHDTQSIGCCPKSNPQCSIPSSCKGFGGDSFFSRFKRADGDSGSPVTCSGFLENSCVTYSYVGGPYDGYHMYTCDWVSSQQVITMSQPLEEDSSPPKTSTTSTTTRPRPTTTQTTRTSTRAPTTIHTTVQTTAQTTTQTMTADDDSSTATMTTDETTTTTALPTTAAITDGVSASNTGAGAVVTSTRSPNATGVPSVAADNSTVPQGSSNTGAIVGGVLGGIAVVAIGIGAFLYFMWYRKKREEENTYLPAMGYTNDSAFYPRPPLGTSQQQATATYGARTSQGGYNSMRGSSDVTRARAMSGAGYGAAAAAGMGAATAASRHQHQRSFSSQHDPSSAFYGKTMDDTAVSPVDQTRGSVSPMNSPNPSMRSPARPVSPPQTYNRFNPPPPEHFRAYKPYEGT